MDSSRQASWIAVVLLWLLVNVTRCCQGGCIDQERIALLNIKQSVNVPYDSALFGWEGQDCCQWSLVWCNSCTSRVIGVDLSGRRKTLLGELWYPNAFLFAQFKELEFLDLSNNNIGGWVIPQDLCGLQNLTKLNLRWNQLIRLPRCLENSLSLTTLEMEHNNLGTTTSLEGWEGQDCCQWTRVSCNSSTSRVIGVDLSGRRKTLLDELWYPNASLFAQFKELEFLDLSNNNIGGWVMPQGLCRLKNLKALYINHNKLVDMPLCLNNLSSLEDLGIGYNYLMGTFDLCGLQNLTKLNLRRNQYIRLPRCLENSLSLTTLEMDNNNLSTATSLEGLCKLRNLQKLSMSKNRLVDRSIPSCLANLSSLEDLDLSNNYLMGSFDLCGLKNLINLNLNRNQLIQLPRCLENLQSLTTMYMDWNNLSTTSFEGLCKLRNLKKLDFMANKLVDASIPSCLGNLSSLEDLKLSFNQLRGSFVLYGLKNLINMDLNMNQLIRSPRFLGNFPSLTTLNLRSNNLSTRTSLEGLCTLRNIKELHINNNKLVDASIPLCLANITSMRFLNLSNNQLKGNFGLCGFKNLSNLDLSRNQCIKVPDCLGNMTTLIALNMEMNNLTTFSLKGLCKLRKLKWLDVSSNRIGGHIPLCLSNLQSLLYMFLSSNQLKGNLPFSLVSKLTSIIGFDLSHNQFDNILFSKLTSSIEFLDISSNNIHEILPDDISLFLPPKLSYLNLSHNFLQGTIPSTLGDIKNLTMLDLSNNNLSGEIPNQLLKTATSLKYLDLSSNRLDGKMLPRHSNAPSLKYLKIGNNSLSGAIPAWISSLQQLNVLILKGNHLKGQIPIQLCQMKNMFILDLSHNHLTGNIPTCFKNITSWMKKSNFTTKSDYGNVSVEFMTKGNSYSYKGIVLSLMTGIDLSSNRLTGCIPSQLGYLVELRSLNFSYNNLSCQIPDSFKKMKQIESLDLSFNQLNGTIPPTLIQLYFLSSFSVAYNNLTGRIPDDKYQFATFDASCYVGNDGLCGKLLNRSCSSISGGADKKDNGKSSSFITNDYFPFYLTTAISYILGIWGFIFLLYFNKDLRWKYFKAVDVCIDYCILQFQLILLKVCNFQFKWFNNL